MARGLAFGGAKAGGARLGLGAEPRVALFGYDLGFGVRLLPWHMVNFFAVGIDVAFDDAAGGRGGDGAAGGADANGSVNVATVSWRIGRGRQGSAR